MHEPKELLIYTLGALSATCAQEIAHRILGEKPLWFCMEALLVTLFVIVLIIFLS